MSESAVIRIWSLRCWFFLALAVSAAAAEPPKLDDETATKVEALTRLINIDLESNAALKGAVLKVLEKTRGTPVYVEIVREFKLKGHGQELLDYAMQYPNESSGIEAFRMAV